MNNLVNENMMNESATIIGYHTLEKVLIIIGIIVTLISLILYRKKATNILIINLYITISCLVKSFIKIFDGSRLRVGLLIIYLCAQWSLSMILYKFVKSRNSKYISIINYIYSITSIVILYIIMINMYEHIMFIS